MKIIVINHVSQEQVEFNIRLKITKSWKFMATISEEGKHNTELVIGSKEWQKGKFKELQPTILLLCARRLKELTNKIVYCHQEASKGYDNNKSPYDTYAHKNYFG